MRLLERGNNGELSLTKDLVNDVPAYAILSHTWGEENQEVTFQDLTEGLGKSTHKTGYQKIRFCGEQAARDGLRYFWVDTCCIKKSDSIELQKSINSMFRWYKNAAKCYVYLSDVSIRDEKVNSHFDIDFESAFRNARWFTRGWTLQELLAPSSVEFFSADYKRLGDKLSFKCLIHEITGIPVEAIQGYDVQVTKFSVEERVSWIAKRETQHEEDLAYSLLGIFNIFLPLIYGEGRDHAFRRLRKEVESHELGNLSKSGIDNKAQLDQLLSSLRDDDMNARINQIDDHHSETFAWIFDPEAQRPWDSFPNWLSCNDKVYWIRGKAGSGKSTLMKFLINANETKKYLDQRAPGHAIYSYFIWNSGTAMQKSVKGLLCSLIYQIFDKNDDIMEDALKTWPHISKAQSTSDWSRDSLEQLLLRSLALHKRPICVFLDGLDEIDPEQGSSDHEGPYHLLQLIKDISSPSGNGVKVCVSSRPEPAFRFDLKNCPNLQLQDLTKKDMETYTRDFVRTRCSFGLKDGTEDEFIGEVVNKADGVFLWVSLALQSLQRGIASGDRPEELMDRLRKLPRKLEGLYENMFERLGEDKELFKKTAALYFSVFIAIGNSIDAIAGKANAAPHWNLLNYAIAFDPALRDTLLKPTHPLPPRDLKNILLNVDQRLTSRCAGLLEVVSRSDSQRDIDKLLSRNTRKPWADIGIQFIHRSAREYLLNMHNKLLHNDETPPSDYKFRILQALVLDDLYPLRIQERNANMMMEYMANTKPSCSQEQEFDLLGLAREIYRRNNWSNFYENAARYGLQQSHTYLVNDGLGDSSAIQNYLLLCCITNFTMRTNTMVSYLLNKGADPNWLGIIPVKIMTQFVYFPRPVLSCFSDWRRLYFYSHSRDGYTEFLEEMIQLFLESGADLKRKFLSYDGIPIYGSSTFTETARPIRLGGIVSPNDYYLITESNCVEFILNRVAKYFGGKRMAALISKFGLTATRKVLLYFDEDGVYRANEDSDAINKILGWPESLVPKGNSNQQNKDGIKEQRRKIGDILKGKEVNNAIQWLTDRGYTVLQKSDLKGISNQASFHEMVEIYQRLNEKWSPEGNIGIRKQETKKWKFCD